jgi:hypothetical protein
MLKHTVPIVSVSPSSIVPSSVSKVTGTSNDPSLPTEKENNECLVKKQFKTYTTDKFRITYI